MRGDPTATERNFETHDRRWGANIKDKGDERRWEERLKGNDDKGIGLGKELTECRAQKSKSSECPGRGGEREERRGGAIPKSDTMESQVTGLRRL